MPHASPTQIVEAFVEAYERRDLAAIESLCAADMTYVDHPAATTLDGREEFVSWLREGLDTWHGAELVDVEVFGDDHRAVLVCTEKAIHGGPMPLAGDEVLAPTGRAVSFRFCMTFSTDGTGVVCGGETFYDAESIVAQLR